MIKHCILFAVRGAGIEALLCFGNNSVVNVLGDSQEADAGLCFMENDAVSFLPRVPWRYKV